MTFTYSSQVSSVKLLGLVRLLRLWRASVYKLVFREILIFLVLFAIVSCVYRFALNPKQRTMFERLVLYSSTSESVMPVTFILGFYVSVVVQRWWSQFLNLGWPDRIMAYISVLVIGRDEHSRMLRRTMIRYLMLSEVLLLMNISAPVKKRFPNLESLVEQGLMTKSELKIYNDERVPHNATKYWVPCQWCAVLMSRARDEKRIRDSFELIKLLEELTEYKNCLKAVFSYDWVSLPLVYTQVATVAVYTFFFTAILSRQFISYENVRIEFDNDTSARYGVDMYIPLEAIMQLFFYLGWLKVAEQMLNPFGEDDDDFECNFIIDRNLKVGLYSVDRGLAMQPKLQRDVWWDSEDPTLGYTEASKKFEMTGGWFGSTADLAVPLDASQTMHARLPTIPEATQAATAEAEAEEEADTEAEAEAETDESANGVPPPFEPQPAAGRTLKRLLGHQTSFSVSDVSHSKHHHHRRFPFHIKRSRRRTATTTSGSASIASDEGQWFGSTPDTRNGAGSCSVGGAEAHDRKRHEEAALLSPHRPSV